MKRNVITPPATSPCLRASAARPIAVFVGVVATGIVAVGYLFNALFS